MSNFMYQIIILPFFWVAGVFQTLSRADDCWSKYHPSVITSNIKLNVTPFSFSGADFCIEEMCTSIHEYDKMYQQPTYTL